MIPLISVIIPVYNVEKYIKECVGSIIAQSYCNIEVLLIDDGSTDSSGKICDQLAISDDRIVVIHKNNKGLSDTRNIGILRSRGEYLYFLDSDDYVAPNTLELLMNLCQSNNADIAITGLQRVFDKKKELFNSNEDQFILLEPEDAIKKMLMCDGFCHEATGKLFHRTLWNEIQFPINKLYEDYATIYKIISMSKKIVFCMTPKYYYRIRSDSIMNSKIEERNLMLMNVSDEVTAFIINAYPNSKDEAILLHIVSYMKLLKGIMDTGFANFPEEQKQIIDTVNKEKKEIQKPSIINKRNRIKLLTLSVSKYLFYVVYCVGDAINKRNNM